MNSVTMKFAYEYSDQLRTLTLENIKDDDLPNVKSRIQAVNASLMAGTAGGLSTFFVSDEGDNFVSIQSAQIKHVIETPITIP